MLIPGRQTTGCRIFSKSMAAALDIKVWDNTGVITIESLDPDVKVRDVLKEFNILTIDENVKASEVVQDKYRL